VQAHGWRQCKHAGRPGAGTRLAPMQARRRRTRVAPRRAEALYSSRCLESEQTVRDLTQGSEAKVIVNFAVPMLIGNVFQQLYTMVDSVIVGRGVGKEALAAVGASFPIIFLMISLVMGITMGASIILSQYFGARDFARLKKTIDTTLIFLFFASLVVTVVGLLSAGAILRAVRTPEEVFPLARQYLQAMFAGMIFLFGYNTVSAILRGLGDSTNPLYFLIIATVVNIVLDLLFVLVFRWGVAGAAWATVIAQGVSFVIGIIYMQRSRHEHLHLSLKTLRFDRDIFRTVLRIGLPSGIQQSLVSLGFVALTRIVNPFGTDAVAGYTAASRLDSFAAMPAMNLSMAVSTFVGQNLGAGKPERVRKGYLSTLAISAGISTFMTLMMILFKRQLIGLFAADPAVVEIGADYLVIVSSFYLLFSSMFITGGVLRGAGDTIAQMFITIVALWIVRIPASAFLSSLLGSRGIWWGIPAGWLVGFTANFFYYLGGRWKRKVVAGPVMAVSDP
jgi:putative MATE family efflux protein